MTSESTTYANYELSSYNHLGNVRAVVSDVKVPTVTAGAITDLTADVVSATDYYPFGMQMPGRSFSSNAYRYGFNGMEKDDEVKGEGNSYTTEYRQYDSRLGRWTSLDPLMAKYPHQSPYAAFNNNPIFFRDPTGLEGDPPNPIKRGTDSYYKDRKADFEKRNPGQEAPEYYEGYGDKYLNRFKNETRETLSPEGQEWLDKALYNLQDQIETRLRDPDSKINNIEQDNDLFTDFAFDTHVDAYEDAGILDLSVTDKVKIVLTVDPGDLFSKRGLKQAGIVAVHQAQRYIDKPAFALEQAKELYNNSEEIMGLIHDYAKENGLDPNAVRDVVISPFKSLNQ